MEPKGVLQYFAVQVTFSHFLYPKSTLCDDSFTTEHVENFTVMGGKNTNFTVKNMLSFASYNIRVRAANQHETSSYSDSKECVTLPGMTIEICEFSNPFFMMSFSKLPGLPEKVENLMILGKNQELNQPYNTTTVITWQQPCRSNSVITRFEIACENLYKHEKFFFNVSAANKEADHFSLRTTCFSPDAFYSISVKAVSKNGGYGKELTKTLEIEAGCESFPESCEHNPINPRFSAKPNKNEDIRNYNRSLSKNSKTHNTEFGFQV